jgi:hypothetical protein
MREMYNPLALPDSINFHKASKEFPLAREKKAKLQIALSKMTKAEIKKNIKYLSQMEYECLEGKARIQWEKFGKYVKDKETQEKVFKELPVNMQDEFKMAAWCKFCREFCEQYLYSLEKQKKV